MARSILTFVFVLLLGSTVQAKLEIANVQPAYGPIGPERKSLVYYPGDEIVIRYTLKGVSTDANGEADVIISLQITDPAGNILLAKTVPTKAVVALGGSLVPGTATATLGATLKPGKYRLGVTANDKLSGESAAFRRDITLTKTIFTSVSQRFFMDPDGKVPGATSGIVGQTLYYRFGLIGFDRSTGRVETRMELEVLDDEGRQVLTTPSKITYKNEDRGVTPHITQVSFNGSLVLNRAGNFGLRFKFTDVPSGQICRFEAPLRVTDP
jgi:hypothetical protein